MPSESISAEMTETLTPEAAARVLTDAAGFERSLARRTHGLTLMTWGLVMSGMFVSYGFAAVTDATAWVLSTLWIPWVSLGILTTSALWRSAALSLPSEGVEWGDRREWIRATIVGLAISVVFGIAQPDGPVLPLGLLGAAYLVFGAFNVFRTPARERKEVLLAGALMLGVAGALAATRAPIEVSGLASFATPAAVLCAIGFYETLTG